MLAWFSEDERDGAAAGAPWCRSRTSRMLVINGLAKTYGSGAKATHAIRGVGFTVDAGEFACEGVAVAV